jgi:hypothetical protein
MAILCWAAKNSLRSTQKHRGGGGNSKIAADVTRIHYAPSPKALNFTARLLLRRQISLRAFSYGA